MKDTIISIKNVTKRFPGITANDDISLDIQQGEIFALLGENGAGKSVLMSMLFGLYEPDEGDIWIKGQRVKEYSPRQAARMGVGMVHQHFKLVENYTIAQNIVLGMEPITKGLGFLPLVNISESEKTIEDFSKRYQLNVNPRDRIEHVNVATRQKVEILKMLYKEADILIFDEPTAILTPQEIQYLLGIIRELRENGKTIILVSHKLEEIKEVADRCGILNRGRLVDVKEVATTSTREMANLMVGREVMLDVNKPTPTFGKVILEVENLHVKNQDQITMVKDVSFTIRSGEIFAIAGVSGNGQTEIAEAITGLKKTASGTVRLNQVDITDLPVRQRNLEGIAYIPEDRQTYGLILDDPVADNLVLKQYFQEPFSSPGGRLNPEAFHHYAERLITTYDIRSNKGANSITRSLSGGNQQKMIIAREIEQDTPLIIFVQPTRGLDVGAIENTWQQILQEQQKGKAILLISLELDEIMALADTIGVIYNGELLTVEAASQLTAMEIGAYMMGVKEDE
ncbi:ABC transporter ATP-binding protein [Tindallia californiensis]|uniref:Nucleoside ABC transporter ATP-binding protein n=1 Tax=Tindallia californiensis TaxID=159292 RepID=A0A1H3LNR7_9FIRM|nr:ABC transporter ATP-binding protein [Tindallia californiensis]SDY65634.1 nucleoside ABC transporter ATP-binding protein [Tindallia californiensis]